jgi:hypothetical protein
VIGPRMLGQVRVATATIQTETTEMCSGVIESTTCLAGEEIQNRCGRHGLASPCVGSGFAVAGTPTSTDRNSPGATGSAAQQEPV